MWSLEKINKKEGEVSNDDSFLNLILSRRSLHMFSDKLKQKQDFQSSISIVLLYLKDVQEL